MPPATPVTAISTQRAAPMPPHTAAIVVMPAAGPDEKPITAFVRMTPNGLVRNASMKLTLSKERGEVWTLGVWNKEKRVVEPRNIITAAGYYRMNVFGGVSFATPENLVNEEGKPCGNPYFHRSPTGRIIYIKVRRIGIGRNALGNLVAIDLTVTYDLQTYFSQDVWAAWAGRRDDAAPMAWGELFASDRIPPEVLKDPKRLIVQAGNGTALVLDLKHKDVIRLMQEDHNRQKFADRNAVTICERNILKKFFGAASLGEGTTVAVASWQQVDRDITQLAQVVASAQSGKTTLGDEEISIERDEAKVEKDEADEALAGDIDEEQAKDYEQPEPVPAAIEQPASPPPQQAPNPPRGGRAATAGVANVRQIIRAQYAKFPPDKRALANDAMLMVGFNGLAEVGKCDDPAQLEAVQESLSEALQRLAVEEEGAAPEDMPPLAEPDGPPRGGR